MKKTSRAVEPRKGCILMVPEVEVPEADPRRK
jgi:hypothetical protein